MRANIIYSQIGKIPAFAELLASALERAGNVSVTLTKAEVAGSKPIPCAGFDLVIVGGPSLGFLGGKLPADLPATLTRCTRLDGKTAAAFVNSKVLGTAKSLKAVMALLEKQGAMVEDFAAIGSGQDAEQFASRLVAMLERRRGM